MKNKRKMYNNTIKNESKISKNDELNKILRKNMNSQKMKKILIRRFDKKK